MRAKGVSAISSSDGPTAVFIAGKGKANLKQRIYKFRYNLRKKKVIKSLKAAPHTMKQVENYIVDELGYKELSKESTRYKTEYQQMRTSFLMTYKPELLGGQAEIPEPTGNDEESIKRYMEQQAEQWKLREEAAMNVPVELFDIDMHIYEINYGTCYSRITVEGKYGYIGASSSGTKRYVKKFDKMYKAIYRYYGVAQSDIDNHTERYDDVVRALTAR